MHPLLLSQEGTSRAATVSKEQKRKRKGMELCQALIPSTCRVPPHRVLATIYEVLGLFPIYGGGNEGREGFDRTGDVIFKQFNSGDHRNM